MQTTQTIPTTGSALMMQVGEKAIGLKYLDTGKTLYALGLYPIKDNQKEKIKGMIANFTFSMMLLEEKEHTYQCKELVIHENMNDFIEKNNITEIAIYEEKEKDFCVVKDVVDIGFLNSQNYYSAFSKYINN